MINSEVYSQQLCRLNTELIKKRSRLVYIELVLFHHDDSRSLTARRTLQKIIELGAFPTVSQVLRQVIFTYFVP